MKPQVFLALPVTRNMMMACTLQSQTKASKMGLIKYVETSSFSILPHNFNILWTNALNMRPQITHFCMLHDDIDIQTMWWLDLMMDIMNEHEADILSVISPIKDKRGLTSTALETDDYWKPKRLTMFEAMERPKTFTNKKLLINTGCMLVDIRNDWVEKIAFKFETEIVKSMTTNKLTPRNMPEDWLFSIAAKKHGAKIYATREIELHHIGQSAFANNLAWGTVRSDG